MIIDTHIFVWMNSDESKLNADDKEHISFYQKKDQLGISAITFWEIALLQKRGRISLHKPVRSWLSEASQGVRVWPITEEIALESTQLPDYPYKDPADRFIIATARVLGYKLLTKDSNILDYIKTGYV